MIFFRFPVKCKESPVYYWSINAKKNTFLIFHYLWLHNANVSSKQFAEDQTYFGQGGMSAKSCVNGLNENLCFCQIFNWQVNKTEEIVSKTYRPSRYCTSLAFLTFKQISDQIKSDFILKSSLLSLNFPGWPSVQYLQPKKVLKMYRPSRYWISLELV